MNQVSRTLDRPDSPTGRGIWISILRNYLLWSTVAHLVWEVAQLPLYTIWTEASLAENAFAVVHCTGGDLIIAGAALAFGLVLAGSSNWPVERFWPTPSRGVLRQIPAGVWVLGFVSMLMDISSEMIHSVLTLFMVTTLGART